MHKNQTTRKRNIKNFSKTFNPVRVKPSRNVLCSIRLALSSFTLFTKYWDSNNKNQIFNYCTWKFINYGKLLILVKIIEPRTRTIDKRLFSNCSYWTILCGYKVFWFSVPRKSSNKRTRANAAKPLMWLKRVSIELVGHY